MVAIKEWKTLTTRADSTVLAWNRDNRSLANGKHDGTIDLWDVETGQVVRKLPGDETAVGSLAFNAAGTILASGTLSVTADPIRLWDVTTGRQIHALTGHWDYLTDLAFSPVSDLLASAAEDVKLWDTGAGREIRALAGSWPLAFSPDGAILVSNAHGSRAWNDYGAIRLWDVATGEERRTLLGPSTSVSAILFGPDGRTLVSVGSDPLGNRDAYLVSVWDTVAGQILREFRSASVLGSTTLHPNGRLLASGSAHPTGQVPIPPGWITFWDIGTGEMLLTVPAHTKPGVAVAFNSSGTVLVSSGRDGAIKLWHVSL